MTMTTDPNRNNIAAVRALRGADETKLLLEIRWGYIPGRPTELPKRNEIRSTLAEIHAAMARLEKRTDARAKAAVAMLTAHAGILDAALDGLAEIFVERAFDGAGWVAAEQALVAALAARDAAEDAMSTCVPGTVHACRAALDLGHATVNQARQRVTSLLAAATYPAAAFLRISAALQDAREASNRLHDCGRPVRAAALAANQGYDLARDALVLVVAFEKEKPGAALTRAYDLRAEAFAERLAQGEIVAPVAPVAPVASDSDPQPARARSKTDPMSIPIPVHLA